MVEKQKNRETLKNIAAYLSGQAVTYGGTGASAVVARAQAKQKKIDKVTEKLTKEILKKDPGLKIKSAPGILESRYQPETKEIFYHKKSPTILAHEFGHTGLSKPGIRRKLLMASLPMRVKPELLTFPLQLYSAKKLKELAKRKVKTKKEQITKGIHLGTLHAPLALSAAVSGEEAVAHIKGTKFLKKTMGKLPKHHVPITTAALASYLGMTGISAYPVYKYWKSKKKK